jgi:spore germination protein GerM
MPATDSPLADTIRLLLQGPTVDEGNRGLITLIPPGARLLSAQVRGSTAYLSFSEEFQFNTYGVEGYIGQLRQIIWTVTEFPNVSDVQILIEGRRIDYLGERIAIGSPLGRDAF